MQLHDAHELKEVYSPQAANSAIQQDGWTLLAVTPATHPEAPGQRTCVCYVLGKPAPKKDPLEGVNLGGLVSTVRTGG